MEGQLYDGEDFKKLDHGGASLPPAEYDSCSFNSCIFTEADLSQCRFIDCSFENCDLSAAKIKGTAFQEVHFRECRMLGLNFDQLATLGLAMEFTGCQLDQGSFYQLKLNKIRFTSCSLREVDFTDTQLQKARFEACELSGSIFENTLLEEADLSTATGYSINPDINHIRGARFSMPDVLGLLGHLDIEISGI